MKLHVFLGALGAGALALSAAAAQHEPLDAVRAIAGGQFGTRSFDGFLYWLVESGPGSKAEYLSAPCYERRHVVATAELIDTRQAMVEESINVLLPVVSDDVIEAGSVVLLPMTTPVPFALGDAR